jgi:DNA-binding response OmpR family regulator
MDLRVLVLIADRDLGELVRAQVENLGCRCSHVETYDDAGTALTWADAVIVDLVGNGLDELNRLRVEAPRVRTLAIAPDAALEATARSIGADHVLSEPFSVVDLITAVRAMDRSGDAEVVDLRTGDRTAPPEVEEAPWFSTR